MLKNDSGIYLRGSIYWLRWTPATGLSQRRTSLYTNDYEEAVVEALRYRQNPFLNPVGTWQEELDHYAKYSTNTRSSIRSTKEVVTQFFTSSKCTIANAQPDDVGNWLLKFSDNTLLTYRARLIGFYSFLQSLNRVRNNPAAGVRVRTDNKITLKPASNFVDITTSKSLVNNCNREDIKFVLYAGLEAGMRKDEIINCCWEWFHLDTHTITIPHFQNVDNWKWTPKTKKGRSIPISRDFHSFLSTQTFSSGFVLHPEAAGRKRYAKRKRLHPRRYRWDFRRPLQEYFQSQNVVCSAHAMRHSFASNLLRGGTTIAIVAKMIGDSISTTERIYANFRPRRGDLDHVF